MSQGEPTFLWETPPELWCGFKVAGSNWRGKVVSLYIAQQAAKPMVGVSEVRAFADRGLEGDRFFRESWKAANRPDKAVSLIEEETLESAAAELGTETFGDKTRRNIVTRGVALNHLVGVEFTVGDALLRGTRLCDPCAHMEKLTVKGAMRGLIHRGGLRAEIVRGGVVCIGDPIGSGG